MVLVVENKKMQGVWWKYGLLLMLLVNLFWYLGGRKLGSPLDPFHYFWVGRIVFLTFVVGAFLPFVLARVGLHRLTWYAVTGFVLGAASFYVLLLSEPIRQLPTYNLIPFNGFIQMYLSLLGIGVIVEFGRYVFKKVFEE